MTKKLNAAKKAIEYIKNGMTLGLGTGSTVEIMIEELSKKIKAGLNVTCVSTSNRTTKYANDFGIIIHEFDSVSKIDLTIDGADEVDPYLRGIKGGGGALLYEKIVAYNSEKNIWIVDDSKLVNKLGNFPLPIEVIPFASRKIFMKFESMKLNPTLRKKDNKNFITDSGNFIIDCKIGEIENPKELEKELKMIPGVVEVGLFIDVADYVIIGYNDRTEILEK
ncbi:Ribose 5-phosphate isomerase [Ignavibacterium album JCM 16511]|uniref:Ribose-5-phosphate isomerase A n=1 Tax=Ignavibacterium album (strain DSM 19864 / JCM 16511 / NBRC 101810 / Mat9-16) TaxID=945713 RepID=I0AN47_IGNAJ|nr:ribose-5-phosphate isomerase RpiA [Ignavibacterium album]AFH50404.1 Ribose 5-phosphate isomerase [Ignavibacterium album JCM 16511]